MRGRRFFRFSTIMLFILAKSRNQMSIGIGTAFEAALRGSGLENVTAASLRAWTKARNDICAVFIASLNGFFELGNLGLR